MTARAFFDRFAIDGRAVLAGRLDQPRVWVADLDGHLVVCHADRDPIHALAETALIDPHRPVYGATALPPCACWRCEAA